MSATITNQNKDEIDEKLKEFENETDDTEKDERNDEREHGDDEPEDNDSGDESDESEEDDESQSDSEDDEEQLEIEKKKKSEKKSDDFKDKFTSAQREVQIQQSKNKKLNDTIIQASQYQPTDQELKDYAKTKGVNFEELSAFEKTMLQDSYTANKRFSMVNDAALENTKVDEWGSKVDEFSGNEKMLEKFPQLAGKEAEFRSFCMKESRRGADLEDLAQLFAVSSKTEKRKGSLLATNSSGKDKKPKPNNQLDDADTVASLRRSDPRKYREMVKAGKIKIEI